LFVNASLNAFRIRDGQIVANNLNLSISCNVCPSIPMILIEWIFDADHWKFGDELLVQGESFLVKFGSSNIHTNFNFTGVSSLGNCILDQQQCIFVIQNIRREATFITYSSGIETEFGVDDFL
ncbi:hypothetical protein Bhyg_16784, partial [Pseudolycoriella hygida]